MDLLWCSVDLLRALTDGDIATIRSLVDQVPPLLFSISPRLCNSI